VLSNIGLYYFSLVVVIVIMIGMTCFYKKCRKVPMNYILLGTYTFFHTYLIGAMSVFYSRESVMISASATMAMFISLTIYAIRTKTDMTKMGGALYSGTMMVVVLIIILSIFNVSSIFSPILICILICLLSVWIVHDTQIIIGGNKYAELELDDYCIGALIIYSDVVTIFSYILQLCGN
jgi:FtsH-binding integral membrane protein